MKENYGLELRKIREEKMKWSLSKAEMESKVSKSYLCRLENSKRHSISIDVVCSLADAYGVDRLQLIDKLI